MGYEDRVEISALSGKVLTEIRGAEAGSDEVYFTTADGETYKMFHSQDCCESVSLVDVVGDVADLIGEPLYASEETNSETDPEGYKRDYPPDSFTWTFYKLGTRKGWVTLRWLGESNGYYGEGVDIEHVS